MSSLRRLAAVVALLMATLLVMPAGNAQIPLPIPTTRPTQDPSPDPEPTHDPTPTPTPTPTNDPHDPNDGQDEPRRPARRPRPAPYQPTPQEREGIELWLTRDRTPARTTTRLLDLLDTAKPGRAPLTSTEARAGFGRFPVVGYVWYQDDYGAPRYDGGYNFHAGTDLFAVTGTPVIGVVDGTIWRIGSFSRGGNAIWLQGDDGVRYYYGHLQAYRDDLEVGARVQQGELLGWVGATGQARGWPHVHFEVNPWGLGTVNPKPILDAWLDDAESAAGQQVATQQRVMRLAPFGAARWDSLFEIMGEVPTPVPAWWTAGWTGSATLAGLDQVLADLISAGNGLTGMSYGVRRLGWEDALSSLQGSQPHKD